jgi:Gluconate 2-dehydrogenase subunit 3
MSKTITRRAALRGLGAGAGAITLLPWLSDDGLLAFARIQQTGVPPTLRVLSATQYATLEALVDAIIPTDERSPGAKDARVADYVDLLLSEADDPLKQKWLTGLAAIDDEATRRFNAPFVKLDATQVETLLTDISRNEKTPQTPLEEFFVTTKQATIHGYYTSEIGIHKDLHYKGNQYLPEFVGCQTEDGKDCPHCGQKATSRSSAAL